MAGEGGWTPDEIFKLIFLVQENEVLYNSRLPGYSNRDTIDLAWNAIASTIMTKNARTCVKKWQILRAGYRSRRHNMLPSGSGASNAKKWVYFDSLSFLEPFLAGRSSITNTPEVSNTPELFETGASHSQSTAEDEDQFVFEEFPIIKEESLASSASPAAVTTTVENSGISRATPKRRKEGDVLDEYLNKKLKTMKKSSSMLFLESLHDEIEKLSERGKRTFKLKVRQLLNEMLDNENVD